MNDTERVKFIRDLINNAWEAAPMEDVPAYYFWNGVLLAIEQIVGLNEKVNNEE